MSTKKEKIIISPNGSLFFNEKNFQCAIGKGGVSDNKYEGDGTTPSGCFLIRKIYYRSDCIDKIDTIIQTQILVKDDGWCDDPKDLNYNKFVKLPYPANTENLYKDDHSYDIIAVLGFNDEPVIPGKGSAIFLHIASSDYSPTEGCIALSKEDILEILKEVSKDTLICITK